MNPLEWPRIIIIVSLFVESLHNIPVTSAHLSQLFYHDKWNEFCLYLCHFVNYLFSKFNW